MLFNLEMDEGARIIGYIVPDGYSTIPKLRVSSGGNVLADMEANEFRAALVAAGRHETGRCGFMLDETIIPGLGGMADLEVREAESGILIYRRCPPGAIKRKLLRIETHLLPLWRLDKALSGHFHYAAERIENFGRETVAQLFLLNGVESVFASGSIYYKNFSYQIEDNFDVALIAQDPFEELAERLLILKRIKTAGLNLLGQRERISLAPLIGFVEDLDLNDPKALKRAFRSLPGELTGLIANPLVRQLTTSGPDEMPKGRAIAAALDVLSSFKTVAMRSDPVHASESIAAVLGLDAEQVPEPGQFAVVPPLAEVLRQTKALDSLLEMDMELHYYLTEASRKAAERSAELANIDE